jgi:hypothetical protein
MVVIFFEEIYMSYLTPPKPSDISDWCNMRHLIIVFDDNQFRLSSGIVVVM